MLLGRLARAEECEAYPEHWRYFAHTMDESIFEGIKQQIVSRSLDAYSKITFHCLEYEYDCRPEVTELVEVLKLALAYQEDHEIWKPRLPKDYEKLCEMSKTIFEFRGSEIFDKRSDEPERVKNFYDLLCKGFLFQDGKMWFSLGSKGRRNVMISARTFSYINRSLRKWQSIQESRFEVAAQMLDISNLKIRIKMKPPQLLLPGDNYGVYLIFRFCEPGKCVAKKQMYVNLKYKRGSHSLHTDFATWREDGWMMIELCRIFNYEEDTDFEVLLLESFSRCYCGSKSVYIQGIEFRTIDDEYEQDGSKGIEKCEETQKYEDIKKLKQVRQILNSCSNMDKGQQSPIDEGVLVEDVQNKKICFMKADPYHLWLHSFGNESIPICFIFSAKSRFQEDIVLSKQQVFGIKGKIESQMLSPDRDYLCYLVFKLSETCHGLHCPAKVKNVSQWKNKDTRVVCFRPPSPWNLPDTNGAPKERDDGWMEVLVWKFNSNSDLRNNRIPMNLKFITYEGTMSGLIVSGLEIRSM